MRKDFVDMKFNKATDALTLSLEDVAEGIGRHYTTVRAYRIGKRAVTSEVRERLASYMRERAKLLQAAADELEAGE